MHRGAGAVGAQPGRDEHRSDEHLLRVGGRVRIRFRVRVGIRVRVGLRVRVRVGER